MKYKLLVLDVDGTFLNKEKEISPVLSTLLKIQQMGVRIVLASGRPTFGIRPIALKLELDKNDGFILSYNGGQIISMQKEELLFENASIPKCLRTWRRKLQKADSMSLRIIKIRFTPIIRSTNTLPAKPISTGWAF